MILCVQFVEFGDLEATRKAVVAGRNAAIFVEPLQGEGGACPATASFLNGLWEICDETGTLLVSYEAPGFLKSVAAKFYHLKSQLKKQLGKNLHVKEVWGQGLLVGIQLDVPSSPLVAAALKAGLLILTAGKGDVICLVPPLFITHKELDQAIDILENCMTSLD